MITVRKYLEQLLADQIAVIDERFRAQETALVLEKSELESRLSHLNRLREEAITRKEYDEHHEALIKRLAEVEGRLREEAITRREFERVTAGTTGQLEEIQRWRSNIMGRAVAIAVVGTVVVAAMGAFIGHLVS